MQYGHGGDIYTYNGILDFSSNINPFGPSEHVRQAACDAVQKMGCYPDSRCRKLTEALGRKLEIGQEHILFGNGAADLIVSIVSADRPKKALLAVPTFSEYEQALRAVGCEIRYVYLEEKNQFELQETYLECLREDLDMIFLCSPNNPTGKKINRRLLEQILLECERKNIRMVLDECFYEFLKKQEEATMQKMLNHNPQLIILRAFTKMHAMPGLRLGYMLCSDKSLMEKIQTVRQPWSVSCVAQAAGIAALDEDDRVQKTRAYVCEERRRMERELERIGIPYVPSDANYILLYVEPRVQLFEKLLDMGILIRDCENYVGLEKGYYRIAVKRREENDRLLDSLKQVFERTVREKVR